MHSQRGKNSSDAANDAATHRGCGLCIGCVHSDDRAADNTARLGEGGEWIGRERLFNTERLPRCQHEMKMCPLILRRAWCEHSSKKAEGAWESSHPKTLPTTRSSLHLDNERSSILRACSDGTPSQQSGRRPAHNASPLSAKRARRCTPSAESRASSPIVGLRCKCESARDQRRCFSRRGPSVLTSVQRLACSASRARGLSHSREDIVSPGLLLTQSKIGDGAPGLLF